MCISSSGNQIIFFKIFVANTARRGSSRLQTTGSTPQTCGWGIKTERCIRLYVQISTNTMVFSVHVDAVMHKLGVTSDGYARISPEERCKANKWLAWRARFCKGETQLPTQYDGHFPSGSTAWKFPECEDQNM